MGYFGFTLSSLWRKLAEVSAKLGLSWPNLAPSSDPVEPKSGNVEKVLVFKAFLKDSMVQNTPHAASADLADRCRGGPGSRYSRFRTSNISGPKGLDLLGLAATRAAARFMGYRRFRRPPLLGERRMALVAHFCTIFKISNFCKKLISGCCGKSLDTRGF